MEAIITRVHDRQAKWESVEVGELPPPQALSEDAMLGAFSYALQTSRKRLLRSDVLISVDGTKDTPPALARDYLTLKHGRAARIKWAQLRTLKEHTRPLPVYVKPTRFEEGFYIDIRSAYWQILRVVGWQVDYYPGKWLMRGPGVRDFPYQREKRAEKLSRNCLVSAAQGGELPRWVAGRQAIEPIRVGNRLINAQLVGIVRDVLHAIGLEAQRAGAIYVATDGYIAPDMRTAQKVGQLIRDWGLDARLKGAGPGAVYGSGSYAVGQMIGRAPKSGLPVSNLSKGEYDTWLAPLFAGLASIADRPD
jgi:hypothetical protein